MSCYKYMMIFIVWIINDIQIEFNDIHWEGDVIFIGIIYIDTYSRYCNMASSGAGTYLCVRI